MRRGVLLATAFAGLAVAAPAGASTLGYCPGCGQGNVLDYVASDGEANHLVLGFDGARWTFTDSVPITLGDDSGTCTQPAPTTVSCPKGPADGNHGPSVDLGDMDDTFQYQGADTAGYPLELDLGSGNNTASGTAGPDTITGGSGNDVIRGMGGDDTITGGGGTDTLDGGDGRDKLDARDGSASTLIGGPGQDEFHSGPGDTVVARDGVGGEWVDCRATPAKVEYDASSTLRVPGPVDDVRGSFGWLLDGTDDSACFGAGNTGTAPVRPTQQPLHLRAGPRTSVIRVSFSCPASALLGCFGGMGDSDQGGEITLAFIVREPRYGRRYAYVQENHYHAHDFFVLPGQHLVVPLSDGGCPGYTCFDVPAVGYWRKYAKRARTWMRGRADVLTLAARATNTTDLKIPLRLTHG